MEGIRWPFAMTGNDMLSATPEPGRRRPHILLGSLWIGAYLLLVVSPLLFVWLAGDTPPGTTRGWDFSIALGFCALSVMGSMFLLTARFRWTASAFGIDIVYYFHRWIALIVFGFVLAHPLILIGVEPLVLEYLKPDAPWHMLAGVAAWLALVLLVVLSIGRKLIRLHYDAWRRVHAGLAVLAVGLAVAHVLGVNYYAGDPGKRELWMIMAVSWLVLWLHVRIVRPALMQRRPYRVTAVTAERGDAWTLTVQPDGHDGLRFLPGQFAWLTLGSSPFAMREHPFSISSSAERPGQLGFTIKRLGDFTATIPDAVPGQRVFLDGPFGAFSIDRHAAPGYVFITGGIGIAPVLGMLRTLADRGDRRPLWLFYAYRTLERLTAYEELESLKKALKLHVVYVLVEPPPQWAGESGCVTQEMLDRHLPATRAEYDYFLCGPTAMTTLVEKYLSSLGVPMTRVHTELFEMV